MIRARSARRWLYLVLVIALALAAIRILATPEYDAGPGTVEVVPEDATQPSAPDISEQEGLRAPEPATRQPRQLGVGANKLDLFLQYLGLASGGDGSDRYRKVTRAMARKAIVDARYGGIPYLRVSATGYRPSAFNRPGDLDFWRRDPEAQWRAFDDMMDDLHANGVQIIPVFMWNWVQFPAMTGETARQMITDPDSESYRLLLQYISEFVARYRDHPALYFYELTNELNLRADLDIVGRCEGGRFGGPEFCGPIGNFTTDEMIAFTSRLAAYVRALDPDRPISSGYSRPRPYAEHLRRQPEFSARGPDFTHDSLAEFRKNLIDIHRGLEIVSVHFYNRDGANQRFGITGRYNADLLDIVKEITDESGKKLFVGEFGDADPHVKYDENALFTQNVLDKIVELEIPYSAVWVWQFYQSAPYLTYDNQHTYYNLEPGYTDAVIARIKETNRRLGHSAPVSAEVDTTTPQVVITWPLDGAIMPCTQLVHAVASANGTAVEKVTFLVEGNLKTTVRTPPYQFHLNTASVPVGTRTVTAKAFDPAGNVGQYTISAVAQMCPMQRFSRWLCPVFGAFCDPPPAIPYNYRPAMHHVAPQRQRCTGTSSRPRRQTVHLKLSESGTS